MRKLRKLRKLVKDGEKKSRQRVVKPLRHLVWTKSTNQPLPTWIIQNYSSAPMQCPDRAQILFNY